MIKKLKEVLNGAGFYGTLAVCVLAVGIGGYYLLSGRSNSLPDPERPELPHSEAAAPTQTIPAEEPEEPTPAEEQQPEAVETVAPEVMGTAPMPDAEAEVDDTPVIAEPPRLVVAPLSGEIVAAFSVDQLLYDPTLEDWRTHDGIDIVADAGTTVLAASAGVVASVEDDPLMGTTVSIDHNDGCRTIYANLQAQPAVEEGDSVAAGQIIGAVGSTAAAESAQEPHLHFSVTRDGDAIDPEEFLNR